MQGSAMYLGQTVERCGEVDDIEALTVVGIHPQDLIGRGCIHNEAVDDPWVRHVPSFSHVCRRFRCSIRVPVLMMLPVLVSSRWSCIYIGRDALWIVLMPVVDGLLECSLIDRIALLMLQATSLVSCISGESTALLVLPLPAGFSRDTGVGGVAILRPNVQVASLLCGC